MSVLEENELCLLRSGNQQAFRRVYEKYFDLVHYVVLRCGVAGDQSRDVVHDTFLKLYNNAGQIREAGKLKSWLLSTARNACMDVLRKQQSEKKTLALLQQGDHGGGQKSLVGDDMRRELELELVGNILREICLNSGDDILCLYYIKGLSAKEIARIRGIALSTVTNQLSRQRKKYREQLYNEITLLKDNVF